MVKRGCKVDKVLRGKPTKPETCAVIKRYEESDQSWGTWWSGLSQDERNTVNDELDMEKGYSALIDEATPDDATLEYIRKEFADGFDIWGIRAIAEACVLFYLKKRLEERKKAASCNKGKPRASRYALRKDVWITAARQGVAAHAGATKRNRMQAAADAIAAIEPKAMRRTITAFVKDKWCEISSTSRVADRRNLSV